MIEIVENIEEIVKKIIPEARTCSDGKSVWVCRSDLYRSDAARHCTAGWDYLYL